MQTAVMFGAGNVGRGFLGQLFHESGYEVIFIDIDLDLIQALEKTRAYPLHLVDNNSRQELLIHPVRGILASQVDQVADAVSTASIAATAVGARALNAIAPLIAKGIEKRAQNNPDPLNFIICENLKDAATFVRTTVANHISPQYKEYFQKKIGFVDTVIGRMVPPPTPEMRAMDPRLILVEPYKELPVDKSAFIGTIPTISGMIPSDNFVIYTARKLYIHNCGHAVLAYLGFLSGYKFGYEALKDPKIIASLQGALNESQAGIVSHYRADPTWLTKHREDLLNRFANRSLGDTIFRLGRDPIRKLAYNDRLVAPARLAEASGIPPIHLARAIAAALCFCPPEDLLAIELQTEIRKNGIRFVLPKVCAIQPDEDLGQRVLQEFELFAQTGGKFL